jgi:hypothetical protein
MHALFVLVTAATLGVEVGWEPLPDGGHEYTIQLEPQLLHVLQQGQDLVSDVPPQLHIRRYRVTVGSGKLAQIAGEPAQPHVTETPQEHHEPNTEAQSSFPPVVELPDAPLATNREEKTAGESSAHHSHATSDMPATLPHRMDGGKPLNEQARYDESDAKNRNAEKPSLPPSTDTTSHAESGRPWLPLLIAAALLCGSLGGNVYLGWIAWHAHGRYRDAVAKFRAAPTG